MRFSNQMECNYKYLVPFSLFTNIQYQLYVFRNSIIMFKAEIIAFYLLPASSKVNGYWSFVINWFFYLTCIRFCMYMHGIRDNIFTFSILEFVYATIKAVSTIYQYSDIWLSFKLVSFERNYMYIDYFIIY